MKDLKGNPSNVRSQRTSRCSYEHSTKWNVRSNIKLIQLYFIIMAQFFLGRQNIQFLFSLVNEHFQNEYQADIPIEYKKEFIKIMVQTMKTTLKLQGPRLKNSEPKIFITTLNRFTLENVIPIFYDYLFEPPVEDHIEQEPHEIGPPKFEEDLTNVDTLYQQKLIEQQNINKEFKIPHEPLPIDTQTDIPPDAKASELRTDIPHTGMSLEPWRTDILGPKALKFPTKATTQLRRTDNPSPKPISDTEKSVSLETTLLKESDIVSHPIVKELILHIDSNQRNKNVFEKSCDYSINFPIINNVQSIQLLSAIIPKSGYIVTEHNNLLHFDEGGGELIAELPIGNYNAFELAEELELQMKKNGALDYNIYIDQRTDKFIIAADAEFELTFNGGTEFNSDDNQQPISVYKLRTVGILLGFSDTDLSGLSEYKGHYNYNLTGPTYVSLHISYMDISHRIPLDTNTLIKYYTNCNITPSVNHIKELKSFHIKFLIEDTEKLYDFNGLDHSLSFKITYSD